MEYTVEQAQRLQELADSLIGQDGKRSLKDVKTAVKAEFPELKIQSLSKGKAHDFLKGKALAAYQYYEKQDATDNKKTVDTVTKPTSKEALKKAGTDKHLQENLIPADAVKYVVYRRVSTQKQGDSGLGLEAQQRDIDLYLNHYSDKPYEIVNTYTDVQSAKSHTIDSRPMLRDAIDEAERTGSVLLVAKLDRLGRSVELIAHLLNRKHLSVRVACMPNADSMQLQIYAVLAEQEREFISKRTKAALAVAKSRGVKLGGYREGAGRKCAEDAKKHAEPLKQIIADCLDSVVPEHRTLSAIAKKLNDAGHRTQTGKPFGKMQVSRLIKRLGLN